MSEQVQEDINPTDPMKFAEAFQLFDGKDSTVWVVFRSPDKTLMAVNYIDLENAVKVKLASDKPVGDAPNQ